MDLPAFGMKITVAFFHIEGISSARTDRLKSNVRRAMPGGL